MWLSLLNIMVLHLCQWVSSISRIDFENPISAKIEKWQSSRTASHVIDTSHSPHIWYLAKAGFSMSKLFLSLLSTINHRQVVTNMYVYLQKHGICMWTRDWWKSTRTKDLWLYKHKFDQYLKTFLDETLIHFKLKYIKVCIYSDPSVIVVVWMNHGFHHIILEYQPSSTTSISWEHPVLPAV